MIQPKRHRFLLILGLVVLIVGIYAIYLDREKRQEENEGREAGLAKAIDEQAAGRDRIANIAAANASPSSYPDRTLVLMVAKHCSNSEDQINSMVDQTVASIEKFTGKPSSRAAVLNQALFVIADAEKDRKYPRNKDGKFEFGAIASAVQIGAVEKR